MTEIRVATATLNIEVNPGEPLGITVPILNGDGDAVAVPVAEDWTAAAQARDTWRAATALHTFAPTVVEGAEGAVRLTATAAQTAAWQQDWPRLVAEYDLWVTDSDGVEHCLTAGELRLIPRTTREA